MKSSIKQYVLKPIWFYFIGFFFCFFQITGYVLAEKGTIVWNVFTTSAVLTASLIGGIAIGYIVFRICAGFFAKRKTAEEENSAEKVCTVKFGNVCRTTVICWLIMILCWLPLFLAYFPGMCGYDIASQLSMFITGSISTHHPVLHTELLGKLWLWSFSNFDGGTIGMAVYVVIQMMVLSLAFTYVILVLKMLGMADKCCYITAVFLGVFPLNGFMAISATKDTIFSAFFVVLFSSLLYCISVKEKGMFYWLNLMALIVSVAGTVAFRNNGKYAVAALCMGMIVVSLLRKAPKFKYAMLFVLIAGAFTVSTFGINYIERNFWHDPEGEREKYSVPFQQVLRTVNYHKEEIDPEIIESLTECVSDEFDFETGYFPESADPVKAHFNAAYLHEPEIQRIYMDLFKQYPGEYLNAFLALNAGYLYIFDTSCHLPYVDVPEKGNGYILTNENLYWLSTVEIYKHSVFPGLYEWLEEITANNVLMKIPVLGQILAPAIWLYLFLFIIAASLTFRKTDHLMPMAFVAGYYTTVMLGPIVLMRYIYPILLCIIVYLFRYGELFYQSFIKKIVKNKKYY